MTRPTKTLRVGTCGSAYGAETVHLPARKYATGLERAGLSGRNQDGVCELAHRCRTRPCERFEDLLEDGDTPQGIRAGKPKRKSLSVLPGGAS